MAFTAASPIGAIQPYLLSQCDVQVIAAPLSAQPHQDLIQAQAQQVADAFAQFVADAHTSLDVCIYDFRLDLDAVRETIVDAINGAAERSVRVRIAFDQAQQTADGPILKQFRVSGGDPAPVGTQHFVTVLAGLRRDVRVKAVAEEAIDPGHQIMHNKYMVRDADADDAAVWTGSTNFTVDAWALQENNLLVITRCRDLAAGYTSDFQQLWDSQRITGTGGEGDADVAGQHIRCEFAPDRGHEIEQTIADVIDAARTRLRVASMVTSSQKILAALKGQLDAGRDCAGVYDRGETDNVRATWSKAGQTAKVALLDGVIAAMVAKNSLPYSPQNAHNFMHDKLLVADDTVVSGSFNFSANATRNAENVLVIDNAGLAQLYADYIDQLVVRYRPRRGGSR